MKSLGFEDDEQIRSFEDPLTWLNYFPPLAVKDLKSIGIHVSMLNKISVQFLLSYSILILIFRLIGAERLLLQMKIHFLIVSFVGNFYVFVTIIK